MKTIKKADCLMILHFRLFYFHHQPAHFCLFFPYFYQLYVLFISLTRPSCILSPGHTECKAIAQRNSSGRANVIPYTLHSVRFATGRVWVILISCHAPTQIHIHTLCLTSSDLASRMLELWRTMQPQMSQLSCDNSGDSKYQPSL